MSPTKNAKSAPIRGLDVQYVLPSRGKRRRNYNDVAQRRSLNTKYGKGLENLKNEQISKAPKLCYAKLKCG